MVQHFLTWLDRNIGFDVDPDHARTRAGRFISRSFFSLRFNDESARTSCVDDTYTPLTPGHLDHDTLFVLIRGLYTVVSKRLGVGMWGNFRSTFFWAWWKESKRRFWQRSLSCLSIILFIIINWSSICEFTCVIFQVWIIEKIWVVKNDYEIKYDF